MAREPKGTSGTVLAIDEAASFPPLPPITDGLVTDPAVSIPIVADAAPPASNPAPIAIEDAPTAPRRVDAQGFELDEWGLPRAGPVRVARLVEMGRVDPNIDPTGWDRADAAPAAQE